MKLQNTDTFDRDIYDKLPELLKECCTMYSNDREKDVFLISALTIISGCMPKLKGIYDTDFFSPNINTFIIAPSASGKRCMKHAKSLGVVVHKWLQEKTKVGNYKPSLFVSGNSAPRGIIEHLKSNVEHNGIICETEADVIGGVMKQEWGDYSPLLRCAFGNEGLSISRIKDFDYIEIDSPKLSVLISGTPDQFNNIITDIDNGLFSRFLYYQFATPASWRDVTPTEGITMIEKLEPYSERVKILYQKYYEQDCKYLLTNEQWIRHNEYFDRLYTELNSMYGNISHSSIVRIGVLCFRIAMVLTAVRNIDEPFESTLTPNDEDIIIAQRLVECLIDHAMLIISSSKKAPIDLVMGIEKFKLYLPKREFTRKEAVELGKLIDMSERLVDKHLSILKIDGYLVTPKYGSYIIADVQSMQSGESSESTDA